ncbi:hypothetical protein E2C01_070964 [Portunus trituberculatus]|uniref:Uncharacterized protein n=1 Tax=Portunus trituberculatus TaxID=210409 RepID=A0A5B7I3Y9_PORTR|nr:hypothetical protein [Portunus trituberculatus]
MDEMASINHQMAEELKDIIEECRRTQEKTKHQAQSLVLRTAHEKERALIEDQGKYDRLIEEKNAMEEQLAVTKKEYERLQEEKKNLAKLTETKMHVVIAARTASQEWYKTKKTPEVALLGVLQCFVQAGYLVGEVQPVLQEAAGQGQQLLSTTLHSVVCRSPQPSAVAATREATAL